MGSCVGAQNVSPQERTRQDPTPHELPQVLISPAPQNFHMNVHSFDRAGNYTIEFVLNSNGNQDPAQQLQRYSRFGFGRQPSAAPSLSLARIDRGDVIGSDGSQSMDFAIPIPVDELLFHLLYRMHAPLMIGSEMASGLGAVTVAALPRVDVDGSTDVAGLGECGITLETFESGDVAVVLPCSHAYKESAISQWLQQRDTCPVCRARVEAT